MNYLIAGIAGLWWGFVLGYSVCKRRTDQEVQIQTWTYPKNGNSSSCSNYTVTWFPPQEPNGS